MKTPLDPAICTREVPTTVTFLEMTAKPALLHPPQPKSKTMFLRAENPPVHFYRYLYDTIGEDYFWVDRRKMTDEALGAILRDPEVALYVLYGDGAPAGMAEIDFREQGLGQLAYFGLMPEFLGRGLGFFFLRQAVETAWMKPIAKLIVNTCTLDHPRALSLYQRVGFVAYGREERIIRVPPAS